MKERMTTWEAWCLKQKRQKNSQGKVREGTSGPHKETARVRTQDFERKHPRWERQYPPNK